jgi:5'-3' exonuclease
MVLDTPSLYFRAFYGIPASVVSPQGEPVNAVRGLLDMIARLVTDHRPRRLVAAMDRDWRPAFRVALLPSYKAHRLASDGAEETPDQLSHQVPVIEEVLAAVGIEVAGAEGHEADDVIGTLTRRHRGPVDVVTGDRDLFQLVEADRVRVLYTQKGLTNLAFVDERWVTERYGIPGRSYADFALLRGDPSDGLPGVPGVGDKTAAQLLARYGSLSALLAALDGDPTAPDAPAAPVAARLRAARDYMTAARGVVDVVCDLPLPAYDDVLLGEPKDPPRLVELADRWGLDAPLNRLLAAVHSVASLS